MVDQHPGQCIEPCVGDVVSPPATRARLSIDDDGESSSPTHFDHFSG
jgi:hypothetical protein